MSKPRIFIASSVEGKDVAGAIEIALQHDAHCTAWYEAFPLSNSTIETLLRRCAENDFAIFIFSPDDRANIRGSGFDVARDNVLFESGLFMGMHGRDRCFLITPQDNPSFHLPTDLLGFTTATYDHERAKKETGPALGAAAAKTNSVYSAGATWKLKLYVQFRNNDSAAVVVESEGFALASDVPIDPVEKLNSGERYPYKFIFGKEATGSGNDVYLSKIVIPPGQSATCWIPIDPAFGKDPLDGIRHSRKSGILHYRLTWLNRPPTFGDFEDKI
jgi:hypothetical protein